MALLQRTRILPNQRLDLPDFRRIEDFVCADLKAIHKNMSASENFVFSGFEATGTGTAVLTVPIANSSLIVGLDDAAIFVGAPSLAALTTDNLSPSTTNYVELFLSQDTGGADSRAFWDATANSNQGAEFSQIVDTFSFLKANLRISTSNFSGASDAVKICEVDVNGSGIITEIRDARDLYYRLGRESDPSHSFPWASRTEPPATQFTGADKDIKNQKQMNDSLMDSIREIKETEYWFQALPVSLSGSFRSSGLSILSQATTTARFVWSGSQLSITDDNGTPLDSDVLSFLRLFDSTVNIGLTRQDGGSAISIADGQVLWVELPDPLASINYDGVGLTSLNYRVSNRGSVPLDDSSYWLAYREGTKLICRFAGELQAGESAEISDNIPQTLLAAIGLASETSLPSYSSNIRGTAQESLVSRLGILTDAVGDEQEDRSGYLRSDDTVLWDGVSLSFTSDIILEFINTKSGVITQHVIDVAQSPIVLNDLESAYILINRTSISEACTVVLSDTTPIPAQSQAQKDVFVLFRRFDAPAGSFLHIPFHKQLMETGQSMYLGATGAAGGGGGGTPPLFIHEVAVGVVDGVNDTFAISHTPKSNETVLVTIDSLKVKEVDRTITGLNIEFDPSSIPVPGQLVEVFYIADTVNILTAVQEVPSGVIDGVNDTFTLVGTPPTAQSLLVFIDGLKLPASEWSLTGPTTIEIAPTSIPVVGQTIDAYFAASLDSTQVFQEIPTGVVNGINDTFTLANIPPYKAAVIVFVDGRKASLASWNLVFPGASAAIQFAAASIPAPGQLVEVYYFTVIGGGSDSLQTAYNNGNTIVTTSGNPFHVSGSATKVAVFDGDIDVTGVIDPKGITFTPQASNPLQPTDYGLWVNTAGELVQSRDGEADVNITQAASGASYEVDKITLTPTDISNGFVVLSGSPTTPADTVLNIIGGVVQDYGVDFTVIGNQLIWNSLGLDGILVSGDKLIVQHD